MKIPDKKIPHLSIRVLNLTAGLRLRLDTAQMWGMEREGTEHE